jgi:hypothetical protein
VIKVKKEGQVFSKKSRCKIDVKMGPVGSCVVCLVCDSGDVINSLECISLDFCLFIQNRC